MAIVTTAEAEKTMKRCQIGTRNYDEANNLHAECYGTIGALVQERDMLRTGDTCARHCEGTAYRIDARANQADAERYRWLRNSSTGASVKSGLLWKYKGEMLDTMIDAAMAQTPNAK